MGRWFSRVVIVLSAAALVAAGVVLITSPTLLGSRSPLGGESSSGSSPEPSAAPADSSATSAAGAPATTTPAAPVSRAQEAVDAATAAPSRANAQVAVAVLDRTTGTLRFNDQGTKVQNSASLAKLFTIVDMLTHYRSQVTEADRALARRCLVASDDNAMNQLWTKFGGSAGVQRVIDGLGLLDTTVPPDPSQWGQVQVSARDMTTVWKFIYESLPAADRDFMLTNLAMASPTGADGFNQAFGLLEPASRGPALAKQGWLCCLQSRSNLHTTGTLDPAGRYVLAVLSRQPAGYDADRAVVNAATQAARRALAA